MAAMLALGVLGYFLLATREPLAHIPGVPLVFASGWAWPALYGLAVVRQFPDAPGAATGIAQRDSATQMPST